MRMYSELITIIYSFNCIEGKQETMLNGVKKGIKEIRAFEGSISVCIAEDAKNKGKFFVIEVWANEKAWLKFLQSETVAWLSVLAGETTIEWNMQKLKVLSGE